MQRRLVREPEARDYLGGISHATMHALRKRGELSPLHIGRSCFYDVTDLDGYVARLRAARMEQSHLPSKGGPAVQPEGLES